MFNTTTILGPVSPVFSPGEYVRRGLKKAETPKASPSGTRFALLTGMRVTGPFEIAVRGGQKTSGAASRVIEKTSPSSGLGSRPKDLGSDREKSVPRLQVELVCQDETRGHDPFWDAPRLLPTFVTQVMGQVMPERRESVSVETAYGSVRSARMALLLDRKS